MNAIRSKHIDYRTVTIYPTFEKVHALLADIYVYLFGSNGELLDKQALWRGKAALSATEDEWRSGLIVVSPQLEDLISPPLSLEAARSHLVFESVLDFDAMKSSYELPPVPEAVWRWWLVDSLWKTVDGKSKNKSRMLIW